MKGTILGLTAAAALSLAACAERETPTRLYVTTPTLDAKLGCKETASSISDLAKVSVVSRIIKVPNEIDGKTLRCVEEALAPDYKMVRIGTYGSFSVYRLVPTSP
ncbi:hypothetical protein J4234_06785 [Candidatus Woesearchaeota archaeon]|nr:hypothetical protein [Candidatus Woesearchaeota archaeon]